MNQIVYNYAVVRFTPYPETEEFVNCGVILACAQYGYLAAKFDRARRKRVSDFFQELDKEVYSTVMQSFRAEVGHACADFASRATREDDQVLAFEKQEVTSRFRTLTRPREGMMRLSEVRTGVLRQGEAPELVLEKVFRDQVERHFARAATYYEREMTVRIREMLRENDLRGVYDEARVGTNEYGFRLPLVHFNRDQQPTHAIKPLNLDQSDTASIYDHGDLWLNRIRRLRDHCEVVPAMLFPVHLPGGNARKRNKAAHTICSELEAVNVDVVPQDNKSKILDFARSAI